MTDTAFGQRAAMVLLAMGLVVSAMLVRAPGTSDVEMFLIWGRLGQTHGLAGGYRAMVENWPQTVLRFDRAAGGGEYPPLGFAWLVWVCDLADRAGVSPFIALKSALIGWGTIAVIALWWMSGSAALAASFQWAIVLSSAGLGYTDVVFAPFLIGALWAVRAGRPAAGAALFVISVLLKWQPLMIAPFLLLHVLGSGTARWRLAGRLAVVVALCLAPVAAVFGAWPLGALRWALAHPFLSGNTLNAAWLATFVGDVLFQPGFSIGDEVIFRMVPGWQLAPFKLVFFLLFGAVLWRFTRVENSFRNCLLFCVLGVVTYGFWNSAVHENHWFMAVVPAFVLVAASPDAVSRWICWLSVALFNVNLFAFYGVVGPPAIARTVGIDLSVVLAVLYGGVWGLLMWQAWTVPRARAAG